MMDYAIEESITIINECGETFNPDTSNFNRRNIQRIGDFDLIFETFLHNPPMGIIKQVSITLRLYVMKNTLLYNI